MLLQGNLVWQVASKMVQSVSSTWHSHPEYHPPTVYQDWSVRHADNNRNDGMSLLRPGYKRLGFHLRWETLVCLSFLFPGKPCCEQPHTSRATSSKLGTGAAVQSASDDGSTVTLLGVPEPEPQLSCSHIPDPEVVCQPPNSLQFLV